MATSSLLLFGALVLGGGLHLAQSTPASETGWREGHVAPPLRLPTIDGQATVELPALRGKRTLLLEFASW